ncbi:MAG: segregation/condensation protein A [Nanoarchaeota archaeon]
MKETIASSVKQEQIHDLLFNRELGWQEIIHDLINTEQLDPWDVNIVILTDKYLERIQKFEETDFFISSKVLLAAAFLLRIKSEILLKKYIKSIDEILFGDKNESKKIDLDQGQVFSIGYDEMGAIPELVLKSPMPRFKKVTLQELMDSLDKAIATENRRIKKAIVGRNAILESSLSLPKRKFSLHDKVKEIYDNLVKNLAKDEKKEKISFSEFIGEDKEERIISFSGLLHLDHQKKVWLEQEKHFDDFNIWLEETYCSKNPDRFADLKLEVEEQVGEIKNENKKGKEQKERLEKINTNFENPMGNI